MTCLPSIRWRLTVTNNLLQLWVGQVGMTRCIGVIQLRDAIVVSYTRMSPEGFLLCRLVV